MDQSLGIHDSLRRFCDAKSGDGGAEEHRQLAREDESAGERGINIDARAANMARGDVRRWSRRCAVVVPAFDDRNLER